VKDPTDAYPPRLWTYCATEFGERFCYFGMRALLAAYVSTVFFGNLPSNESRAHASVTYGGYTALVFSLGVLGGHVADRYFGYERSVIVGAAFITGGMTLLLANDLSIFLLGLSCIVVGSALFKPSMISLVGRLFDNNAGNRDAGFTIFYISVNVGAVSAPLVCGTLVSALYGARWGLFAAALGMPTAVFAFLRRGRNSSDTAHIERPAIDRNFWMCLAGMFFLLPIVFFLMDERSTVPLVASSEGIPVIHTLLRQFGVLGCGLGILLIAVLIRIFVSRWKANNALELQRFYLIIVLLIGNTCFFAMLEQAGTSLNFLARDHVALPVLWGWTPHFTTFQSAGAGFVLLLGPGYSRLWQELAKRGLNPQPTTKFALALLQVGAGFFLLALALRGSTADHPISWGWLMLCYLLHTSGELCIAPTGFSAVTQLAPPKEIGLLVGAWFLSFACANFGAGLIAAATATTSALDAAGDIAGYISVYDRLGVVGLVSAGVMFLATIIVRRCAMHELSESFS